MDTNLTIEALQQEEHYRLIRQLPYSEIPDFVMEHLFRRNRETFFFWLSVILFLFIAIQPSVVFFASAPGILNTLWYGFLGLLLLPVLLIPLHEGIHALVLVLSGGRNIRVGADLKNFFFYVTAHRYPIRRKTFTRVALAPFFVINTALWITAWLLPGYLSWSFYLALFSHATMCAGDFAMLSFYNQYEGQEIITYDDVEEKTAYFYLENKTDKGRSMIDDGRTPPSSR